MADGKPFKLHGTPDGRPAPVADRPKRNDAQTNEKAVGEKTLVEAAQETQQPDYELDQTGPVQQPGKDGERPVHKPANPWPAAKPVQHKPFKL